MPKVQRGYLKISGSLFSAFHFRYSESSKVAALSVTRTPFAFSDGLQPQTPLIGVHENTVFYLLYNGILGDKRPQGGNVLTRKVLAELPGLDDFVAQGRQIVVYGEARLVGDEALRQKRITFKQIPYHVTGK